MKTTQQVVLDTLEQVAEHLGEELSSVVFVGATAAALYRTAKRIRPTNDVDLLTKASLPAYYALRDRLRERGFQESTENNAPICRLELNGLAVDVMVPDPRVLGHNTEWFAEAYEKAETFFLPSRREVRAITPPYFVATKLSAFADRGGGIFRGSKDIEDIINLFSDCPDLLEEIRGGQSSVFTFIRERLSSFLSQREFEDAVFGCFDPDAASQREPTVLIDKMKKCLLAG